MLNWRETDPVPSECPHRQTSPPLLRAFTHWYRAGVLVEGVAGEPGFAGLAGGVSKASAGEISDVNAAREMSQSSKEVLTSVVQR